MGKALAKVPRNSKKGGSKQHYILALGGCPRAAIQMQTVEGVFEKQNERVWVFVLQECFKRRVLLCDFSRGMNKDPSILDR